MCNSEQFNNEFQISIADLKRKQFCEIAGSPNQSAKEKVLIEKTIVLVFIVIKYQIIKYKTKKYFNKRKINKYQAEKKGKKTEYLSLSLSIYAMHVELGLILSCRSLKQTKKNYILKSYSTQPTVNHLLPGLGSF